MAKPKENKIVSATIAAKSIKGFYPYEFTYEDGSKGIYLPENQMEHKGKFKTAEEVFNEVNKIVATKGASE